MLFNVLPYQEDSEPSYMRSTSLVIIFLTYEIMYYVIMSAVSFLADKRLQKMSTSLYCDQASFFSDWLLIYILVIFGFIKFDTMWSSHGSEYWNYNYIFLSLFCNWDVEIHYLPVAAVWLNVFGFPLCYLLFITVVLITFQWPKWNYSHFQLQKCNSLILGMN